MGGGSWLGYKDGSQGGSDLYAISSQNSCWGEATSTTCMLSSAGWKEENKIEMEGYTTPSVLT